MYLIILSLFFLLTSQTAQGFDSIPFLEEEKANGFFIFNDDMIEIHGEDELMKKLGHVRDRFHEVNYDQFAHFKFRKGTRVQVHRFHKNSKEPLELKVFTLPDKPRVLVHSNVIFLIVNQSAYTKNDERPNDIESQDGFAYLGTKFKLEVEPSYKTVPFRKTKISLKTHPVFRNSTDINELDIRSSKILFRSLNYDVAISIQPKSQVEHFVQGQTGITKYGMPFYGWLKGYDAFSLREYTSGKCRRLIFINDDGVKQVKLPCLIPRWKDFE